MAGVSSSNIPEQEIDDQQFDRIQQHLDLDLDLDFDTGSAVPPRSDEQPYLTFNIDDFYDQDRNFDGFSDQGSISITNTDLFDRGNQANFVMNLFQERVEQSYVMGGIDFGEDDELGSGNLELDLGLGLGLGFGVDCDDGGDDDDEVDNLGFMFGESGDDYFENVRRGMIFESGIETDDGESSSTICGGSGSEPFMTGLRVIGFESDSDIDDDGDTNLLDVTLHGDDGFGLDHDDDTSVNICWDSLQLEEHHWEENEDFEWEEVEGRIDDIFLGTVLDPEEERRILSSVSQENQSEEEVNDVQRISDGIVNLGWEILSVETLQRNIQEHEELDPYFTADYEMLFGQFTENENAAIWPPPASKSIVEKLPLLVITEEDEANNNAICAVCKDEMKVGESAKQLPCLHKYHGDCIVPWLCIRNTCPVCRHELPTDDADYEHRRIQRAGRGL